MILIAAVDRRWNIGCQNQLLFHIPRDMRRFRALTEGNVVIMGRKTLESLPGGRPLPRRANIVLTRDASFAAEGALVCRSLPALKELLAGPACAAKQAYVIGGAQIYALLEPYCEAAEITHVCASRPADCAFPRLSRLPGWQLVARTPFEEKCGLRFCFARYTQQGALRLE